MTEGAVEQKNPAKFIISAKRNRFSPNRPKNVIPPQAPKEPGGITLQEKFAELQRRNELAFQEDKRELRERRQKLGMEPLETIVKSSERGRRRPPETLETKLAEAAQLGQILRSQESDEPTKLDALKKVLERVKTYAVLKDVTHDIVDKWIVKDDLQGNAERVQKNLTAMAQLEARKPGSTRELYYSFGIRNFGDYTTDALIKQYELRKGANSPVRTEKLQGLEVKVPSEENQKLLPLPSEIISALKSKDQKQQDKGGRMLIDLITYQYLPDSFDTMRVWRAEGLAEVAEKHLRAMIALEKARPRKGSVKALNERFGIHNFGDYPLEFLLHQFDTINDTQKPYGIILYPTFPKNTEGSMLSQEQFLRLYKDLSDIYNLRIVETENKSLVSPSPLINGLVSAYGEGKALFVVISGEEKKGAGGNTGILFGALDAKEFLTRKVFEANGKSLLSSNAHFLALKTFIKPNSTEVQDSIVKPGEPVKSSEPVVTAHTSDTNDSALAPLEE